MPDERFQQPEVDERPWHQKSPYAAVENDYSEMVVHGRRVMMGVQHTFTREAMDLFHEGRMCGECHDWQTDRAWPKECQTCHADFHLAHDRFMRRYEGEKHVGTTIKWQDEFDRMDDELERENWEEHKSTGIVIPSGVRL